MDDKGNEIVISMALKTASCITALITVSPTNHRLPLEQFKDSQGNLDDVKLIKAFNDDKTPLVFTAKTPIPADAVTASASGWTRTSVLRMPNYKPHASQRRAVFRQIK